MDTKPIAVTGESTASRDPFESITIVRRVRFARGWRFVDQDGNVLRKCATRAYTHMAINRWANGGSSFLSFHSTAHPKPTHRLAAILRVIPIEE